MIMMIDHLCFRFSGISHIRKEDVLVSPLKGISFSLVHIPKSGLASPYGFPPINMCPVPCWVSVNDNNRNIFYLAFLSTLISLAVVNFLMYVSSRDYFQIPEKTWGLAFLACIPDEENEVDPLTPSDEEVRLGIICLYP